MSLQRDLFRAMLGAHSGRQAELFALGGHGRESDLRCEECGSYLVETPSGYLCCPNGHGRLHCEAPRQGPDDDDTDGSGLCFPD